MKLGFSYKHGLATLVTLTWLILTVACLRRASSWTITRPSSRQCDNPTWSHTALLSRLHARCRSPFWTHNRRVGCWGGALWRACILTMSQWPSGLTTCLLLVTRGPGSEPLEGLEWNWDSPVRVVLLQSKQCTPFPSAYVNVGSPW